MPYSSRYMICIYICIKNWALRKQGSQAIVIMGLDFKSDYFVSSIYVGFQMVFY